MHTLSYFTDIFGEETDRSHILRRSMQMICQPGTGVIILIWRARAYGYGPAPQIKERIRTGQQPPFEELRDFGVGAQILAELGVHDMILLTNAHQSLVAVDGYGLSIVGERLVGE